MAYETRINRQKFIYQRLVIREVFDNCLNSLQVIYLKQQSKSRPSVGVCIFTFESHVPLGHWHCPTL